MQMYNPAQFKKSEKLDLAKLHEFIGSFGFATVITAQRDQCSVSHLPLVLKPELGERGILAGHMAKANPHWKEFELGEVLCVFHGPHGYISPSWYADPLNVPTWNYSVVHARGKASLFHDEGKIEEILGDLVVQQESQFESPWRYELPQEFRSNLTKGVVAFEITIDSIEGKFKLSQNRSREDWATALSGVERNYGRSNPALVAMMKKEFST